MRLSIVRMLLPLVAALVAAQATADTIVVIGAGYSGLSAACELAVNGHNVTVVERLVAVGGRAQRLTAGAFVFDAGPSFYWMPEVIDSARLYTDRDP